MRILKGKVRGVSCIFINSQRPTIARPNSPTACDDPHRPKRVEADVMRQLMVSSGRCNMRALEDSTGNLFRTRWEASPACFRWLRCYANTGLRSPVGGNSIGARML